MERHEKKEFVKSLTSSLVEAKLVIVVQQKGLTVSETQDLRQKMRQAQAQFKVAKNTLIKIAIQGTAFEPLAQHLKGPTALAFSQDLTSAAKIICEYADKNEKVEIVGAILEGQMLNVASVQALAKLPSLDVLRSQLVGILQAPATKMARIVQAPASSMARLFSARVNKT